MPGIPTSSYALGTPAWRQRQNQYASPDAAYQRSLESMLGPFAFQQQFGQQRPNTGATTIKSPSVTPVNDITGLLGKLMTPQAPAAPQQPQLNATQRGFGGAQMGNVMPQQPGTSPRFQTGPNGGLQMPPGYGPQPMRAAPQPTPQPAAPQPQARTAQAPNLQQSANQAVQSMFPELLQGLQGYGQPMNAPMDALSQMATQAGQTRADQLSSGLDRDMSSALAQLFQQGRQQQIGMTGDIGNFQIGLFGQQQQEQQNLARILQSLLLGVSGI